MHYARHGCCTVGPAAGGVDFISRITPDRQFFDDRIAFLIES
jgi:hypothetical protein